MKIRFAAFALMAAASFTSYAQSSSHGRCSDCVIVQDVHSVKRKGEGGAAGMVGGAVVGGLLGNQVGGGTGKTLATVGGAAAGAYAGNEVQKRVTSKTVWVTKVKLKDGSTQTFEQDKQPAWKAGQQVRLRDGNLAPLQ